MKIVENGLKAQNIPAQWRREKFSCKRWTDTNSSGRRKRIIRL